jgi:hypothetical protein
MAKGYSRNKKEFVSAREKKFFRDGNAAGEDKK